MGWHCKCENNKNINKPWCYVHIAPVNGGTPSFISMHIDCLKKVLCENKDKICGIIYEGFNDELVDMKITAEYNMKVLDKTEEKGVD